MHRIFRSDVSFSRLWPPARFGRFLSVGAIGAIIDTMMIAVLTSIVGITTLPAKLMSAEFAIVMMFILNERWTFSQWGEPGVDAVLKRIVTSNLVRAGGLALATIILLVLSEQFGVWVPLANMIGILVGFGVNYLFESLLTWHVYDVDI